jgi:FkbM family methyltransferase
MEKIMNELVIPKQNLGNYIIPNDVAGGIAVDIGSNVGGFLQSTVNIFSEIYYYEPIKACFDICREFSDKYGHIHGRNVAVFKDRVNCKIVMHNNCLAGSSAIDCLDNEILNLEHKNNGIINEVSTVTLEDIHNHVGDRNIDYLKCDCEISEYDIFMRQDLSWIKYLGIELHWQMGEEKFNELITYICKTHNLLYGNPSFPGMYNNRELLFRIRS